MGDKSVRAFRPDFAVPPGDTLLEVLESEGISQSELADRTGRPKKTINEIINGKAAITQETALQLERVLGVPAAFWSDLEQQYRAALALIAERERLKQQVAWLERVPVRALLKVGWVEKRPDNVSQLDAVLAFFGVASVDAWQEVWGGVRSAVAFRQARTFESDFASVAAWLRKGELSARQVDTEPYNATRFRAALAELRPLTRENPNVFCPALVERCATAGVAVCFVPELPQSRVCGATRWLSSEKALIQLSLRYRTNDHLWFTFFHEAGHILLHGKRAVFVEQVPGGPRTAEHDHGNSGVVSEADEAEANQFAADFLIPPDRYAAFVRGNEFSIGAVQRFAESLDIAPGIVVGRLLYDKRLPWTTPLNRLKQSYRWAHEVDPATEGA